MEARLVAQSAVVLDDSESGVHPGGPLARIHAFEEARKIGDIVDNGREGKNVPSDAGHLLLRTLRALADLRHVGGDVVDFQRNCPLLGRIR